MTNEEIRKSELNENEMQQVSGGSDKVIVILQPYEQVSVKCPRCSYTAKIRPDCKPGDCPDCNAPLEMV